MGIHVRMEDHTSRKAVNNGKTVASPQYYITAMAYFRKIVPNVTFVVLTKNPTQFKKYVSQNQTEDDLFVDVTFLERSESAAVDMEILARLDHVIISVGTFGWWAAYRNNGTVVCYKDFFRPGTHYAKQFRNNATDYLYPGWVIL